MKKRASILTLSLIILLILAQGVAARQVFLSLSTAGGPGVGVELPVSPDLAAVFSLQQRGFVGGVRHQLLNRDLFAGLYIDTTHPKGSVAASIGTRIPERNGVLLSIEGGIRSRGDVFVLGGLGWRF